MSLIFFQAVPHSRRETHDSYNDETFGSTECTSEDRAEEERKRRGKFSVLEDCLPIVVYFVYVFILFLCSGFVINKSKLKHDDFSS